MQRRCAALAALAGLVVYCGGAGTDIAHARTLCETSATYASAPSTAAPAPAVASSTNAKATAQKPAHADDDDTAVAAGGSAPAPGDDGAVGNLAGGPGVGARRHGLRWQSMLPGVIK